jgi:ABC-type Fe3+-hydroxamate transport system substrate-binding protein
MPAYQDQTGRWVTIEQTPHRIISLVPSQTELLFELGLNDHIIGITRFCIHPQKYCRFTTKVGGTKQLKMDIIQQLDPDLIIANKEENVKEQVEYLSAHYPVWISDVNNLPDALAMITQVGILTGRPDIAKEMAKRIHTEFSNLHEKRRPLKAAYLIWQNPYMVAGGNTFINAMMKVAGFENVFAGQSRYPETNMDELISKAPEVILLSSEPFPFSTKHKEVLQPYFPGTKIVLTDGELFSWYGSRLLKAPDYFRDLWGQINS